MKIRYRNHFKKMSTLVKNEILLQLFAILKAM